MSGTLCIYIPVKWGTSIEEVLRDAGFETEVRARKFNHGMSCEYQCKQDGVRIGFSVAPSMDGDSLYLFAMGSASSKHAKTLISACDALIRCGALDEAGYNERRRSTGKG